MNPDIASMWESLDETAINQLKELSNVAPVGLISASTNFSEGRTEENGELITILAQPQRDIAQIIYHSLKSLPQRGLYSKQPDLSGCTAGSMGTDLFRMVSIITL